MALWKEILWRILGRVGYGIIFLTAKSLRWTVLRKKIDEEIKREYGSAIYAFWHGRQFLLVYTHAHRKVHVLVSRSRDGEIIHRILAAGGNRTVRGSTTRGGSDAYQELINVVTDQGFYAAFTPDGPKGPACKVAPGIIALAARTQKPIVPMSTSSGKAKYLKSWDKFLVPCPFSTGVLVYGDPLFVPADCSPQDVQRYSKILENELNRITALADKTAGKKNRTQDDK